MIDDLHAYVEASFSALSKAQLTSSYSKLAEALGYSTTLVVDSAKLDSAFASAIVYSTLHRPVLTDLDEQAPFVAHPMVKLAAEIDTPFDIHDTCARFDLAEKDLRRSLPEPLQDAQIVIYPVHRAGRLVLYVGCSGERPDQSPAGRALLHTSAHVLFDRYAAVSDIAALSRRQSDCLFWAAQGRTYTEIGKIVGVSTRTVRAEVAKAKRNLNARTKAEAIAKAIGRPQD